MSWNLSAYGHKNFTDAEESKENLKKVQDVFVAFFKENEDLLGLGGGTLSAGDTALNLADLTGHVAAEAPATKKPAAKDKP